MNLDDLQRFHALDAEGMLAEIDGLPDQLEGGWEASQRLPLPAQEDLRQVVIAGMGGSAIGGDLLAAYAAPLARIPITVWRNYGLPAHAGGPETLVIASSHSGNTEETLSAFEEGLAAGVRLLAVTTGGALGERARIAGASLWRFEHQGQPRAAVGYSFSYGLAALSRLGLIPDPSEEMAGTLKALREQQTRLQAESPVAQNPAKRMGGQLVGRWPTVIGSDFLEPVARRWRTQIAELAKAVAQFEALPEADHNMLAGSEHPEALFGKTMVVFLRAAAAHPRNLLRLDLTREFLMVAGFNTDVIEAQGESRLAQQWTSLHFGDYAAYYLAMAYGMDPTPVAALESLKARLKESPA